MKIGMRKFTQIFSTNRDMDSRFLRRFFKPRVLKWAKRVAHKRARRKFKKVD